jgi:hypothetical protein
MAGGGKGANHGGGGIPGLVQAFLLWDGGDLLLAGRGRRGDSQAYLGPRALCRARDMMIDWAVLPPAGGCGRSVDTGRPPGPARQDR